MNSWCWTRYEDRFFRGLSFSAIYVENESLQLVFCFCRSCRTMRNDPFTTDLVKLVSKAKALEGQG